MQSGDDLRLLLSAGETNHLLRQTVTAGYETIETSQIVQVAAGKTISAHIDGSFSGTRYVASGARIAIVHLG